jgi:predicted TIM-barrel fold metal-dependent hydrolase
MTTRVSFFYKSLALGCHRTKISWSSRSRLSTNAPCLTSTKHHKRDFCASPPIMGPFITLEEHYLSSALNEDPGLKELYSLFPPHQLSKLRDLGAQRLTDMDAGDVSLQVVSHGPGVGTLDQCQSANNSLAAAIKQNSTRLAGFATLPMGNPQEAAEELERCIKSLGFVGALLENHYEGRYYDDEHFWTVFEMAEKLDTVLYIHPAFPTGPLKQSFKGNYSSTTETMLGIAGWGWHADTGLHILRLIAAGLFDRFPKLKIVIGHMGEMLPFQLDRILTGEKRIFPGLKRGLREVWDENLWITTSGMVGLGPFSCLLRTTKIDRILYSVDYPFSSNEQGMKFLEEVRKSGMVTDEDLEMVGYKNAEVLLKVKVIN